ncbi:restriction endonuclease, partial [Aeromonas caviae]
MTDGKQLESLVAFVEEKMLPEGFAVVTNQRIYNDDGVQIAEFDVEIRGRLGTTDLAWLIECRDRPGSGPAPGSWIEQLVGRRSRFGFNKVTAVSTTGFAEGARDFAKQQGIELRTVEALTPAAFGWLGLSHMSFVERRANLESARLLVNESTSEELQAALSDVVKAATGADRILRSVSDGTQHTMAEAFLGAVESANLFEDLEPGDPREGANKRGNSSRLTQSFHFFSLSRS